MREIATIETSLSPPAFSSADPTGNDNYYFTEQDADCYGPWTDFPQCERAVALREGRLKVGDIKVDIPDEVLRKGEYLPAHYFDYIAGTSVGGLIAIMLGVMGRTVEGCLEEFRGSGGTLRREGALPELFVEMDEGQEVDVGDGSVERDEKEREKAERRRRVISFPGLGKWEIPLFGGGGRDEKERDKRRTTWPTKKSRAWFETFAKFSATSTDLTGSAGTGTETGNVAAATRAIVSDTEEVSPKTAQRRGTNNSDSSQSRSSTTTATTTTNSSPASSISFKKNSFQCQTLAWCSEIDSDSPTERHPYAFCTYEEVLVTEDPDEEGKVPSIPEVAKAITTPSDSSQFKPFKLPAIGQFVDGSKEIRDPTLPVLKEIASLLGVDPSDYIPEPPINLILSLGTDEHNAWFYEKLVQPFTSSNSSNSTTTPSPPPETPSKTTTPSPAEKAILRQKGNLYHHYRRFQVSPLSLSPVVSSLPFLRRRNHLKEIEEATERWLAANNGAQRRLLRKYAEMLVRKRRQRSATTRWETFALGARYFCWHEGCGMNPDTHAHGKGKGEGDKGDGHGEEEGDDDDDEGKVEGFDTRGDFWDHLNDEHRMHKMAARGEVLIEEWLDKGRRFGFL